MSKKEKTKVPEVKNNGGVADKSDIAAHEERLRRGRFLLAERRRRADEYREASEELAHAGKCSPTSSCAACGQVASEVEAGGSRPPEVVVFAKVAPEGTSRGARAQSASRGDDKDPSETIKKGREQNPSFGMRDHDEDLAKMSGRTIKDSEQLDDSDAASSVAKDEASRGGAPTVVIAGSVSVSLRYHHEVLLRASASGVIDAVVAEEAVYGIFLAHSNKKELGEVDASPPARGDSFGDVLRRRLDYARQRGSDESFARAIVAQLIAALKVVESRADQFARDYAASSRELGALAAHDFVKVMDKDYRRLGDDYRYRLDLWGKFLGLVEPRGVVVELLGEDLRRGVGVEEARKSSYRGDAEYLMKLEAILGSDVRQAPSWRQGATAAVRDLAMRLFDGDARRGVGDEEDDQ